MKQLFLFCLATLFGSVAAQTVDSIPTSGIVISYSSLHGGEPDTVQVEYDRRGNRTSSILISQFKESGLGMPVIVRDKFDNLNRHVKTESFAFSYENHGTPLSMKDTASVLMDTMLITHTYNDTSKIEKMVFKTHSFGCVDIEESVRHTFYDSLDRETSMYAINPEGIKREERYKQYKENHIISRSISRHSSDKIYSDIVDTVFLDMLGVAFKKRIHDEDKALKYKNWHKCGTCEHLYFRNDSNKIVREIWQDFKGQKVKETLYDWEKDKVITKTSRLFKVRHKGDTLRVERYEYDRFGSMTYWEHEERKRITRWQKVILTYTARRDPPKH